MNTQLYFLVITITFLICYLLYSYTNKEHLTIPNLYNLMSFGNDDKFFNEAQKKIKDKEPYYGIQMEANPGLLRDIFLMFEKNSNSLFSKNQNTKEFPLNNKNKNTIRTNIYPKIEKEFLKELNQSKHLKVLKTDKDYPEEPFFLEYKDVLQAVTQNDKMGLLLYCYLYREHKYFIYHLVLDVLLMQDGSVTIQSAKLHGFSQSADLKSKFGHYMENLLEPTHCDLTLNTKGICPNTNVPDLAEYRATLEQAENEYLNEKSHKCFGKGSLSKIKCISKNSSGRIGIWDAPCKKDDDCPFFQANKNYPNTRGKCLADGTCELPLNMRGLGFKKYDTKEQYKPLCHNCPSIKDCVGLECSMCCDLQKEQKKVPDYAFSNDKEERKLYKDMLEAKNLKIDDLKL